MSNYSEYRRAYPNCIDIQYTNTSEQLEAVIAYHDRLYIHNNVSIGLLHAGAMEKQDCDVISSYFQGTDFQPKAAYLGKDINAIRLGHLLLLAETNGSLYKIDFAMDLPGRGRIVNVDELRIVEVNGKTIPCENDERETPYGFGGLWKYPLLETYEQKNIHALNQSLQKWSSAEGIKKEVSKLVKKRKRAEKTEAERE